MFHLTCVAGSYFIGHQRLSLLLYSLNFVREYHEMSYCGSGYIDVSFLEIKLAQHKVSLQELTV